MWLVCRNAKLKRDVNSNLRKRDLPFFQKTKLCSGNRAKRCSACDGKLGLLVRQRQIEDEGVGSAVWGQRVAFGNKPKTRRVGASAQSTRAQKPQPHLHHRHNPTETQPSVHSNAYEGLESATRRLDPRRGRQYGPWHRTYRSAVSLP